MALKVENPAKYWEGQGGGGGSIGRIRYFAAGEDVPSNYEIADSGEFRDLYNYEAWRDSEAGVFGGYGLRPFAFTNWQGNTSSYSYLPNGRNQLIYKDVVFVNSWNTGNTNVGARYLAYDSVVNNSPWTNLNAGAGLDGPTNAWNITNGKLLVFGGTKLVIKHDPMENTSSYDASYTLVPSTAVGGVPTTAPVYFKGKYYTVTPTLVRTCLGVDWAQWPTTAKFWGSSPIVDLIVGRINGDEVLVAVSTVGEVWSSTDGTVWTAKTVAPDITLSASTSRLVYDGNGAFWLADNVAPSLWWSEDLVTWNVASRPTVSGTPIVVSRLDAGGGYVVVAGGTVVSAFSIDRGATWQILHTTNDQLPYSNTVPSAVSTNGGYVSTLTSYSSGTLYGWQTRTVLNSRKPRLDPLVKAGVSYTPYVKVR